MQWDSRYAVGSGDAGLPGTVASIRREHVLSHQHSLMMGLEWFPSVSEDVMDDQYTPETYGLKNGLRIKVRPAQRKDVKALHAHFLALDVISRAHLFGKGRPLSRKIVRMMIEKQSMLVARDLSGTVIGHASFATNPFKVPEYDDCADIDMSVAAGWRRRGVGAVLLQALVGQARSVGIRRIVIDTRDRNLAVLKWLAVQGAEEFSDPGYDESDGHFRHFMAGI